MFSIPWWVASLISNVAIIFTEYQNRTVEGNWLDALPITIVPIVVAQWCLFHSFNGAPHWMIAWATFTVANSIIRVAAVYFYGGEVDSISHVILGCVVMIGGAFLMKEGLR
jgi:hypothetical protein